MLGQFIKRHNPLGCIVTDRGIRLAQVLRSQAGSIELATQFVTCPEGDVSKERTRLIAEAVRQLVKTGGFQGRSVVSAVPADDLWCRKLRLAPMPDGEVSSAAHWLAAKELGVGVESFTSETLKLATVRDGSSKIEVLTIGCETKLLDEHARMLTQAGLEPMALDAVPWAVARALTGLPSKDPNEPLLILDIGFKSTDMIVACKGEIGFLHRVDGGILRIAELLAHRLDVPLAEAKRLYEHSPEPAADAKGEAPAASSITPQQAIDGAADAAAMFGRELAREVSLSLFHYREALSGTVPEVGVLINGPVAGASGDGKAAEQILQAVTQLTGIRFHGASELLSSGWRSALEHRPGGMDPWLVPLGLALYDVASVAAQTPAEAA